MPNICHPPCCAPVWTETVDAQEYADFLWNLLRRVTRRHGAAWKALDPKGKPFAATFRPPLATFKPARRGKKSLSKAEQLSHRLQAERVQAEREAIERKAHAEKMRTAHAKGKANRFDDLEKSAAATNMQAMWRGRAERKAAKEREQAAKTIGYVHLARAFMSAIVPLYCLL